MDKRKLQVKISDREKILFEGEAFAVSSKNEIGIFDVLGEHANFVTVGLVAEHWEGEAKVMEPDEITEWRWFSLDDLPKERYFPSFEVIENYQQRKFYIER